MAREEENSNSNAMETDEQQQQQGQEEQRQALKELDALQEVRRCRRLDCDGGGMEGDGAGAAAWGASTLTRTRAHLPQQRVLEAVGVASRAVESLSQLEALDEAAVQEAFEDYLAIMKVGTWESWVGWFGRSMDGSGGWVDRSIG